MNLHEDIKMKLSTRHTLAGRVIFIETDEELDLKCHGVFADACKLAQSAEHSTIDVELMRTRNIRCSGVAMLLMLRELTGCESPRIRLLNCDPDIRNQLLRSQLVQQFQVM
jgi:hypothetical protein